MKVKVYKVTDIETGEQHFFERETLSALGYAFYYDEDVERFEISKKLANAIRRGKPTFGLEQALGVVVEEKWEDCEF